MMKTQILTIAFKTMTLDFEVNFDQRKQMSLRFLNQHLVVYAPSYTTLKTIKDWLLQHESRVIKYYLIQSHYVTDDSKTWFNNQKLNVYYTTGKHLSYTLDNSGLSIIHPSRISPTKALLSVKNQLALQYITYIFEEAVNLTQMKPVSMTLKHLKTSWGNCNRKKEIKLSYRLIECDQRFIHYVCIHELVHLKHMNHSAEFYAELIRYCPDYKQLSKLTPYRLKDL